MHMKQVRIKLLVSQSYKLKCNMGVPSPLDVCQELVLPTKIASTFFPNCFNSSVDLTPSFSNLDGLIQAIL